MIVYENHDLSKKLMDESGCFYRRYVGFVRHLDFLQILFIIGFFIFATLGVGVSESKLIFLYFSVSILCLLTVELLERIIKKKYRNYICACKLCAMPIMCNDITVCDKVDDEMSDFLIQYYIVLHWRGADIDICITEQQYKELKMITSRYYNKPVYLKPDFYKSFAI